MSSIWTEADFATLSWHDNYVHAVEIHEDEQGDGSLALHLDHILEWLPPAPEQFSFVVAPAVLRFREVSGLRIDVDYLRVTAAVTPFSISGITRDELINGGHTSYRWTIGVNWPDGAITFESPGFVQELVGPPVVSTKQCLSSDRPIQFRGGVVRGGPPPSYVKAQLDGSRITDWDTFHSECMTVFGFPDFYGRNMNAWIDCLTYVRGGDGMSRFNLGPDQSILIEVANARAFRERVPDVFAALLDSVAFVNLRQQEIGETPALHLLLL